MSPSYNGWEDEREEEREGLHAWESNNEDESWRGDLHPDSWPEYLAGGEYWLKKKEPEE